MCVTSVQIEAEASSSKCMEYFALKHTVRGANKTAQKVHAG